MNQDFLKVLRKPIFASIIVNKSESLILFVILGFQFTLAALHLPGWPCPIKAALGIPCPGCGLSTAIGLLLHGDWAHAINVHLFAPIFLVGFGVLTISLLLPESPRQKLVLTLRVIEERYAVSSLLLICLFIYWGLRLLWAI